MVKLWQRLLGKKGICMWMRLIRNPILFQGRKKKKEYFEGWYFKQVSGDLKTIISIIPGISLDENDSHCFIQVIANNTSDSRGSTPLLTEYFRFSVEDFVYKDKPFSITIGENCFSEAGTSILLEKENMKMKGRITFGPFKVIEKSWISPGIMGPFAYIPKMECNHGIISMTHTIEGSLELNGETISFENGRGYIEKDWGKSFPSSYLWLHSNHFNGWDTAFMCSVAHIPFLGGSFKGFICNLQLNGKEYRFATYNGSKLKIHEFTSSRARLDLTHKNLVLRIDANMENAATLRSPHLGSMSKKIKEGLFGTVGIRLENSLGEIIFEGLGSQCGIELMPKND